MQLQPHFTICVYEAKEDKWISGGILQTGKWEPEISLLIGDMILILATSPKKPDRKIVVGSVGKNFTCGRKN